MLQVKQYYLLNTLMWHSKCSTSIISFNRQKKTGKVGTSISILQIRRLKNRQVRWLSEVTHIISGTARSQTQQSCFMIWILYHILSLTIGPLFCPVCTNLERQCSLLHKTFLLLQLTKPTSSTCIEAVIHRIMFPHQISTC